VNTPSPSGFEYPVLDLVEKELEGYIDKVIPDVTGNRIFVVNPSGSPKVMLAGHSDEVGLMVTYVNEKGFIYFRSIGGVDPDILPARRVIIHTKDGPVRGVIGELPIHLKKRDEQKKKREVSDFFIDIGLTKKKEAEKKVAIGDPITFDAQFVRLSNDIAVARAFDDRVAVFVLAEAIKLLKGKRFDPAVYFVGTVQEEIGSFGARTSAFGVDPDCAIAMDVNHATDYPGISKEKYGDISLGKGPVIAKGAAINPVMYKLLLSVAREKKIPYQSEGIPSRTGTDADSIRIARSGVATALVSIPNRYMHTPVEAVSLSDLENSSRLVAEFILSLKRGTNFIPTKYGAEG